MMQVAGTEQGITEPEATFSACFGGAFLLWHPMKYASMLAEKMDEHGTNAWLVNTGWTGGRSGSPYMHHHLDICERQQQAGRLPPTSTCLSAWH